MKIRVFYPNSNGKVEFTRDELERELQKVYDEGFRDGKGYYPWSITYGSNDNNNYAWITTTAAPSLKDMTFSTAVESNCCCSDAIKSNITTTCNCEEKGSYNG